MLCTAVFSFLKHPVKGDDREDVIEETNTNHGVKSHVKKRPIMTVTFPKNVPQIKNIKRKLHN